MFIRKLTLLVIKEKKLTGIISRQKLKKCTSGRFLLTTKIDKSIVKTKTRKHYLELNRTKKNKQDSTRPRPEVDWNVVLRVRNLRRRVPEFMKKRSMSNRAGVFLFVVSMRKCLLISWSVVFIFYMINIRMSTNKSLCQIFFLPCAPSSNSHLLLCLIFLVLSSIFLFIVHICIAYNK